VLWVAFATDCEAEGTPPARSADNAKRAETWTAPRTPPPPPRPKPRPVQPVPIELAEEPEQPAPAAQPPPVPDSRKIVGWIIRDKDGKEVARIPTWEAGLPQRREQIARALEPLVRNAVEPYEKVAAKRALDMALAAAETKSGRDAIQAALDMYQADVERAVRLKTGK